MNDVELYKALREVKKFIKLSEENEDTTNPESEDSDIGNESSLDETMSVSLLDNDAVKKLVFNSTTPKVKWINDTTSDEIILINGFDAELFRTDTNKKKYAQVIWYFLRELDKKKAKFTGIQKVDSLIEALRKKLGIYGNSAKYFFEYFMRSNIPFKEQVDSKKSGKDLVDYLCSLFQVSLKMTSEKDIEYAQTDAQAADLYAVQKYSSYFAWVKFCKSLQSYDVANYSRLKYVLYEYLTEGNSNIMKICQSYGIDQGTWKKKYEPQMLKMLQDANIFSQTNCKNAWFSQVIKPNLSGWLEVEDLKKEIRNYTDLVNMLLTATFEKVGEKEHTGFFGKGPFGLLTNPLKGEEGKITIKAIDENGRQICRLWYAPGKNVDKEIEKSTQLKAAYSEKKQKSIKPMIIV